MNICTYCNTRCENLINHLKKCNSKYMIEKDVFKKKESEILEDIIELLQNKYDSLYIKNNILKSNIREINVQHNSKINIYKETIENYEDQMNIIKNNENTNKESIENCFEEYRVLEEKNRKIEKDIETINEDYSEQSIVILQLTEYIEKNKIEQNVVIQLKENIEKYNSEKYEKNKKYIKKLEEELDDNQKYRKENIKLHQDLNLVIRKYKKIKRVLISNKKNII